MELLMLKKTLLIVGLFLSSVGYADILTQSEKTFNEQVMNIMKDIEAKSINVETIDQYLMNVNASNNVKQALKSNVELQIQYSDFLKIEEGLYICNKRNAFDAGYPNSTCKRIKDINGYIHYKCVYYYGRQCHDCWH